MRGTVGMKVLGMQIGNAVDGKTLTTEQAVRRWIALGAPFSIAQVFNPFPTIGIVLGLAGLHLVHLPAVLDLEEPDQAGFPRRVREHDGREGDPSRRLIGRARPVRPGAGPPGPARTAARGWPASSARGAGSSPRRGAPRPAGAWRAARPPRATVRSCSPSSPSSPSGARSRPASSSGSNGVPRQPHRTVRSFGTVEKQTPWSTPWTWRPPSTGRM